MHRPAKTRPGTKKQPGHQDVKKEEAGPPWEQRARKVTGEALGEDVQSLSCPVRSRELGEGQ